MPRVKSKYFVESVEMTRLTLRTFPRRSGFFRAQELWRVRWRLEAERVDAEGRVEIRAAGEEVEAGSGSATCAASGADG